MSAVSTASTEATTESRNPTKLDDLIPYRVQDTRCPMPTERNTPPTAPAREIRKTNSKYPLLARDTGTPLDIMVPR